MPARFYCLQKIMIHTDRIHLDFIIYIGPDNKTPSYFIEKANLYRRANKKILKEFYY